MRADSRYALCSGITDVEGRTLLTERVPYRFRSRPDNRVHTTSEGEDLFRLAGRYFRSFERPAGLYWVIADYQPEPILDPTLRLAPGRRLIIPSERCVREEILSETRRREFLG